MKNFGFFFFCRGGLMRKSILVLLIILWVWRRGGCTVLPLWVCLSLSLFLYDQTNFLLQFFQQLLVTDAWNFKTLFVYVCHMVGSIFVPIRYQLSVNDDFVYFYTKLLYKFTSKIAQQLWLWNHKNLWWLNFRGIHW